MTRPTSLDPTAPSGEAVVASGNLTPDAHPSVLRNPNFRRLYIASVTSAGGASVAIVSISWLVYVTTRSALAVTYVGLAAVAPGIALGLVAGALADRYNRRRVMILSDVSRAILMTGLAGFLFLVGFNLIVILGAVALVNGFTVLFFPASSALLPRLVRSDDLEPANGLLYGSTQAAQMLGAAAGGAAIAVAGVVPGLAVNALTYAISATFVVQIAATFGRTGRTGGSPAPQRSLSHEIGEGMAYMRANPAILEVTLGFLPGNFFWTMVTNFTVVYVATYFPGSPGAFGYLVAGLGGGFALGALFAVRLKLRRFAGLSMALIVVLQGVIAAGLTFSHYYPVSLVLAILLGTGAGIINTVYYATVQAIVPDRVLGRVLSVDQVGGFAGIPAGLVLGGVLATEYGIGVDYLVAGLGLLVNGLAMLALKDLRGLRYEPGPAS